MLVAATAVGWGLTIIAGLVLLGFVLAAMDAMNGRK